MDKHPPVPRVILLLCVLTSLPGCDQVASLFDNRPTSTYDIDQKRVPHNLHHLIPYAERWGISDPDERVEYLDAASAEDLDKLIVYVNEYRDQINTFINRFPSDQMSDDALGFMYLIITIDDADEYLQ